VSFSNNPGCCTRPGRIESKFCALPLHPGGSRVHLVRHLAIVLGALTPVAAEAAPLQYLSAAGDKAMPLVWLTWGLLLISVVVIVIIALLLAAAIWHRPGQDWTLGEK